MQDSPKPAAPPSQLKGFGAVGRFFPKYLYALVTTPFLFTVGALSKRHRFLIFQIAQHFGLKMDAEEETLPVLPLTDVLDTHLDLNLFEVVVESGNVSLLELIVISNLARRASPPVCLEIGTFDGRTTLNLAANLPENGHVFTVDLPQTELGATQFELAPGEDLFVDKTVSGARFIGKPLAAKITQLFGDSATFDFSTYAEKMGLVFVDGSHAFDYVLRDSATALGLASPEGGIILWHDYQPGWPGVIKALNRLQQSDPAFAGLRRIEGTTIAMMRVGAPRPRLSN